MKRLFQFFGVFSVINLVLVVMIASVGNFTATKAVNDTTDNKAPYGTSVNREMICNADINGSYSASVRYDEDPCDEQIMQAAIIIRDNMIARNEKFDVTITSTSSDYNGLVSEAFQLAISERLAQTSDAGDYLANHYKSYSYTGAVTVIDGVYQYAVNFKVVYYTTVIQEKKVAAAIQKALKEMNIQSLTDYQKARAIHDYVCDVCNYSTDKSLNDYAKFTAYGAIINKSAVCQGYSTLLYRMLKEAGLNTRIITSPTHSWNIVELDGLYYNLDATWDDKNYDNGKDYVYCLTCDAHFDGHSKEAQYKTAEFNRNYKMANCKTDASHCTSCSKGAKAQTGIPKLDKVSIKKISAKSKGFMLAWDKQTVADGYEIQYSETDKFAEKATKKLMVKKSEKAERTVGNLKANKKYYIRVRAYKNYNEKKYYSSWTTVKNVKAKK